jgi:hypothetical protein
VLKHTHWIVTSEWFSLKVRSVTHSNLVVYCDLCTEGISRAVKWNPVHMAEWPALTGRLAYFYSLPHLVLIRLTNGLWSHHYWCGLGEEWPWRRREKTLLWPTADPVCPFPTLSQTGLDFVPVSHLLPSWTWFSTVIDFMPGHLLIADDRRLEPSEVFIMHTLKCPRAKVQGAFSPLAGLVTQHGLGVARGIWVCPGTNAQTRKALERQASFLKKHAVLGAHVPEWYWLICLHVYRPN